jgi:surface antigen
MEGKMLFRTSTLRSRLALCAASVALAFGLVTSSADAGSSKKPWLQQHGSVVSPGDQRRAQGKPRRGQQPAQARGAPRPWPAQPAAAQQNGERRKRGHESRYVPPAPQPPRFANNGNRRGHDRRYVPPAPPPAHVDRDRRRGHDRRYVPPAPPPAHVDRHRRRGHKPRYTPAPPPPAHAHRGRPQHRDGDHRRHRGDHRHYRQKPHHRHTEHHVYRYYYYRTSPRHYYYGLPQTSSYPVYYLVPYHVHTAPGYHNHGEQTNYCGNGYTQGGVYTGGAYTAGASHQPGATIIGGILGAAAGSQVGKGKGQLVAVGVGTVIGALIGRDIGRSMDQRDRAYATGSFGHAMETAPSCTTITWNNQQTGNYGSITPVQTYEPEPGRYCREFQQQVVVGGKVQDAYGTACRQPDGSWEIVAEQP